MAYDDYYDTRRRSSYFPNTATNKGFSLDPRFTGGLQPSPTGSYYNPSRYAGMSPSNQGRAKGNLATAYTQDLEFNRLANPGFQTGQDTGASSTAPFGSGRASPASVQNYAQTYGYDSGNGLSTFQTPSGGSITYRPSGRQLSGGLKYGGSSPYADTIGTPGLTPAQQRQSQRVAQQRSTGTLPQGGITLNHQPNQYGILEPQAWGNFNRAIGKPLLDTAKEVGAIPMMAANAIRSFFPGSQSTSPQPQSKMSQNFYAYNPSPVPSQPRRYFDY